MTNMGNLPFNDLFYQFIGFMEIEMKPIIDQMPTTYLSLLKPVCKDG